MIKVIINIINKRKVTFLVFSVIEEDHILFK